MRGAVFSYLEKKLESDFEGAGWNDDISSGFAQRNLPRMMEALHGIVSLEEEIRELQEEIQKEIRFY